MERTRHPKEKNGKEEASRQKEENEAKKSGVPEVQERPRKRKELGPENQKKRLSVYEYKFSMYTPSMIAAASVAAALHGLDWTGKSGYGLAGLLDELTRITAIEQDYLQSCLEQIEEMVSQAVGAEGTGGNAHQVSGASLSGAPQRPLGDEITSQEKILEHEKAGTPTDGDSLLSLEAEEEAIPSSDDDAEEPTARKRMKMDDEAKLEQENTQENS
ncbi:G1/S-specific cyclin-D3 [Eufriesea mexicana]|uniref:G1/S-specific cyclin-D3 n=1 Tax=Eufriesea mexicana TaxID=516756 RepID=A0A310SL01_9HYME|nr:G1/S-specific cyclin-D3 [Eufriesea mexicana]